MKPMRVPESLHDVLGESASPVEVALVLVFGVAASTVLTLALGPELAGLPWWRVALGWALVADIAAGCVANFTRSTSDFYGTRSRNRWGFIAVHVHVLLVAWAFGAPMRAALAVWAYTIGGAALVNLLHGRRSQVFVAGLLLAVGLSWLPLYQGVPRPLVVVNALFLLKVLYSFAVDHYAPLRRGATMAAAGAEPALRDLTADDAEDFVDTMSAAFARDPLFVALLGSPPEAGPGHEGRLRAIVRFLFAMNRLMGGTPRGLFVGERLVGCALLEPPLGPRESSVRLTAVALRFVPVFFRLGRRTTRLFNRYLLATREAAPSRPHHYLTMIGVHPDAQSRGWGKLLMNDALDRAASVAGSAGVALDTENPTNVELYARWGFEQTSSVNLDGLVVYSMFRPPRPARQRGAPARGAGC